MPKTHKIKFIQPDTGKTCELEVTTPDKVDSAEYVFSVNPTVADLDKVELKSVYEGPDRPINSLPGNIRIDVTSTDGLNDVKWECTDNVDDYPDWALVSPNTYDNKIYIYKTKEVYATDDITDKAEFTIHLKQDVSNKIVEVPVSQTPKKPKSEFSIDKDQIGIEYLSTPEEVRENELDPSWDKPDLTSYVDVGVHSLINGKVAAWEGVTPLNDFPSWLGVSVNGDFLRLIKQSHDPDGVYSFEIVLRQTDSGLEDSLVVNFNPYDIYAFPRTFDGNFSGYEYETINIPFTSYKIEGPSWVPMDDIDVNFEIDDQLRRDLENSLSAPLEVSDEPRYDIKPVSTEDGEYVGNFVLEVTWESVMFTCIREIKLTQVESGETLIFTPARNYDVN